MKRLGLLLLSICFVFQSSICFGVAVPFKIWLNTNQSATPATNESTAIINSTSNTVKWQRYNGSDWVDLVYSGLASGLSGVSDLPNGTTATTQTQADASTKVATTAYVDTGLGTKQATVTWGTGLSASGATASFAPTELDDVTWGAAAGGSQTWTWDTGSSTDPTMTVSDSYFTFNKIIQAAGIETTRSATVGGSVIIGYEGSNNGDSYVALKAPDARDTSLTFLYPTADPSAGQSLVWSAPSTGVSTGTWATQVKEGTATGGIILGDSSPDAAGELGYDGDIKYYDASSSKTVANLEGTQTFTGSKTFQSTIYLGDGGDEIQTYYDSTPAADDTWSGGKILITAGEALAQWDLLYAKNASGTLKWYKYDCNDATYKLYAPRAIALDAISQDAAGAAGIGTGIARNDGWGMTSNQDEGKSVWASGTAGAITLTAPATSGDEQGKVGYVLEENVVMFSLGNVVLAEVP